MGLALQDLEEQRELGDLHGLGVYVHAVDVGEEDPLPLGSGQPPGALTPNPSPSRGRGETGAVQARVAALGVLLGTVLDVLLLVPVEEVLVRAEEERPRPARGVEHAQRAQFGRPLPGLREPAHLVGRLALQEHSHRVLDDVVHDVRRGVVDPACLAHLGLCLDHRAVARGEPDDLAQELLVHLAQDVGGQDGELVRAVRVVEAAEDVLEDLVVHHQAEGQLVGRLGPALLGAEVEQARVVPLVGAAEQLAQPGVDVRAVEESLEPAVGLDPPVLADAQEDDPVDRALDGEVELALGEPGVAQGEVAGQLLAPALDLGQERVVHLGGAPLGLRGLGVPVERALEDGFLGEDPRDLVPPGVVLVAGQVEDARGARRIAPLGLDPAVVHGELGEVGEDGQRELGRPRVAPELERGPGVVLDLHAGALRLHEELARPADAERVVGGLGQAADDDRVLVDHVLVRLGVAGDVGHVPAQRGEERVHELDPRLGLVVRTGHVRGAVLVEPLDQGAHFPWRRHRRRPRSRG